ncbi:MAG TPA: RNA pseudouridine synthase [Telluria sp.]|nr:RNA pseudouridine synthase [Telluria sp.]
MDDTIRLNKRVAEQFSCSRGDAEAYIEGGWVSVDGVVVEEAGARVRADQAVALQPGAKPERVEPVTIVLHKPAGVAASVELITAAGQQGGQRFLRRHLHQLELAAPLDDKAAGMVVYTQDYRVARKFRDETPEHELLVEVTGALAENGLAQLNQGMKVSWQSEGRLRFATKVFKPGLVERLCAAVGLKVKGIRRIRIGRIPLAQLPAGQWRYLHPTERF